MAKQGKGEASFPAATVTSARFESGLEDAIDAAQLTIFIIDGVKDGPPRRPTTLSGHDRALKTTLL